MAEPRAYKVVLNHEEQYSIWPTSRENPIGWRDAGCEGSKEDCFAYIETVWTDMRPLSLRQHLAAASQGGDRVADHGDRC